MSGKKSRSRKSNIAFLSELSDYEEPFGPILGTKSKFKKLKKHTGKPNEKENQKNLSPRKSVSVSTTPLQPMRRFNKTKEKVTLTDGSSEDEDSEENSDFEELFQSLKKSGVRTEYRSARKAKSSEKHSCDPKSSSSKKLVTPMKILKVEVLKVDARKCLFSDLNPDGKGIKHNYTIEKKQVNSAGKAKTTKVEVNGMANGSAVKQRGKRARSEDSNDSLSHATPLKKMRSDVKERSLTPITPSCKRKISDNLKPASSGKKSRDGSITPLNKKTCSSDSKKSECRKPSKLQLLKSAAEDVLKALETSPLVAKLERKSNLLKSAEKSSAAATNSSAAQKVILGSADQTTVIEARRKSSRIAERKNNDETPLKEECVALETSSKRARSEELEIKSSYFTPLKRRKSEMQKELQITPTAKIIKKCTTPRTPLEEARVSLHVSTVPESLPCREREFNDIYNFIENKVVDGIGGCMYISGVPGTGKTATVTSVIRALKKCVANKELPPFSYLEINGMRLSDPRQAYVQLWQHISSKNDRISTDNAQKKLDAWFNKSDNKKSTTVVLVDELDIMCTKKQDVVYNLLDWPSRPRSRLVVLTIANTMDMPERKLKGRVNSRLGLTRLTFLPYTHKQLEEIVLARLHNSAEAFIPDAVRLATRKVAAVSGDARRALDICRRATEFPLPDEPVKISHIENAIREMTNSHIVKIIKSCSEIEKLFLSSISDVCMRSGLEEVDFLKVLDHLLSMCTIEGLPRVPVSSVLGICNRMKCFRLLYTNNHLSGVLQRLTLNFTQDDLHYALKVDT